MILLNLGNKFIKLQSTRDSLRSECGGTFCIGRLSVNFEIFGQIAEFDHNPKDICYTEGPLVRYEQTDSHY